MPAGNPTNRDARSTNDPSGVSSIDMNRLASFVVAVAAGIATVTLTPSPAHAATAMFVQDSTWPSGYVGRMTVTNDGASAMPAWRVEFDLPAGTTIAHQWNVTLTRTGSHYVITGAAWNASLAPGASTSFGWVADGPGVPLGCLLNGAPCDGRPPARDVQPPTTPTGLRGAGQGNTFTLQWAASTDDVGVTGYEIYNNTGSGPIATVTATSFSMPTPPPMVMTFGVRAVDAAGNRSPFVTLGLGTAPDVTPPGPPANLMLGGPGGGFFTVRWEAPRDEGFVAGYEVSLNGRVVRLVGATTAFVPYSGFGTYWVGVRAFDGAGNFSTPVQIGIAIDPPPPPPPSPPPSPGAR